MNNTTNQNPTSNVLLFVYENKEIRYFKGKEILFFRMRDLLDAVGLADSMGTFDVPDNYCVDIKDFRYVTEAGINWIFGYICTKHREKEQEFYSLRKAIYVVLNEFEKECSVCPAIESNSGVDLPLVDREGFKLVDSRIIAEALGLEHQNLRESIQDHKEAIEKSFGPIRFETGSTTPNNPKPPKFALLTEDQALFVGTLSRNTEKVVEFKARLVKTFQEIRRAGDKICEQMKLVSTIKEYQQVLKSVLSTSIFPIPVLDDLLRLEISSISAINDKNNEVTPICLKIQTRVDKPVRLVLNIV